MMNFEITTLRLHYNAVLYNADSMATQLFYQRTPIDVQTKRRWVGNLFSYV